MKHIFTILICGFLASCAYTPDDVLKQNERYNFTSSLKPSAAASCIAKAVDNEASDLSGQIRNGEKTGTYEVVARMHGNATSVITMFMLEPKNSGSSIDAYTSLNLMGDHKRFPTKMVNQCQ